MLVTNARFINVSGWYDVTVTPDDGEPFGYTVAPDDDAETAVAIRAVVAAQAIPIAAYVALLPGVPSRVSAAQAKLALDAVITFPGQEAEEGVLVGRMTLLDDLEAVIAAIPVRAVRIWFADANVWERTHPYVSALALEMSLDDDAIDALFIAADRY
ncbi:hypothetical protein [Kaistia terrae]|uniref:DUF4376 domain-containing protein n=1 Tax=Kaistia terrae TaxID=537017 RepID=A0ABW0Q2R0_9HYPH|nr:hypothetical protein [Kaistia terrae]MCX5581311.1 hypothetical protein [Kaistia terrae]